MTPKLVRGVVRLALSGAGVLVVALSAGAQQATTTGTIRGAVLGPTNEPLNGATVVITSTETGVRRGTLTNEQGRYQVPFLDPGVYTVRAQYVGYRPVERPAVRVALAEVQTIDFKLEQAAVQLQTQEVVASADPLIEANKTGTSTRISEEQIRQLPTLGRNFKDLTLLAPGVVETVPSAGSGGSQSQGGGRPGGSNILMDGANNNENFFGGDARGGDRAPFSYSIEAVKEIQVITSVYDVERGNFTGGLVNAVTKSGTNQFHGAAFGYLRDDKLGNKWVVARDFNGLRIPDFQRQQYGFTLGGPIIKNRAHFFFSLDRQTANDPRRIFPVGNGDEAVRASGINRDTLANFLRIAREVYGWDLSKEIGNFAQNTDESAFFGRVDWQINDNHKFTLRDNFTKNHLSNDRLTVDPTNEDLLSNGGGNDDQANSLVGSLQSVFRSNLTNELRVQYATEHKPRPGLESPAFGFLTPQVRITGVRSVLSDGSTFSTNITFGTDPIIQANDLKQRTLELIDNVRWTRGPHSVKVGGSFMGLHTYNRFWNNYLGSFTFNSTADFENQVVNSFTRTLPFTGNKEVATQEFDTYEFAGWVQDEWQMTSKLFVNAGIRYDYSGFPTKPDKNPQFEAAFPGLTTQKTPTDATNFSPRVGFAFDPGANGEQVIRGGTGIFYGRFPFVVFSNALANSGRTQLSLNCTLATAPTPNFPTYGDQSNIPSQCVGGGQAAAGTPVVNVFDPDFKSSYAWKSNLAYDRLLSPNLRITVEGVYGTIRNQIVLTDYNLNATPYFKVEGGIPVYVNPARISTTNGSVSINDTRRNSQFSNVWVYRSLGSTKTRQGIVQLKGTTHFFSFDVTYTYDNTQDNYSPSCCTLGDFQNGQRPNGNPNNYDNQWGPADYNRRHSLVVAPRFQLPWGIQATSIIRSFSGRPYTPTYTFDINGDGGRTDRSYVPTREEISTLLIGPAGTTPAILAEQARQRGVLEQIIGQNDCLRENRGQVVGRNACRQPWQTVVDARFSKRINTIRGQNVEIQADFFNLLNGIKSEWGRRLEVPIGNRNLLSPSGFVPQTQQYRYTVNEQFGQKTPATIFTTLQFQTQVGIRYSF